MKLIIILLSLIITGCSLSIPNLIIKKDITKELEDHTSKLKEFMAEAAIEERNKEQKQRPNLILPAPVMSSPPPPVPHEEPKGSGSTVVEPIVVERKPLVSISESTDVFKNKLFSANLAFVVRDKANIADSVKAQLLIDTKKDLEVLSKELTVAGNVTTKQISVSRIVKATLVADNFDITNITENEQILTDNSSTEWLWTLKPKTAGKHEVNLSVTAIIKYEGKETKHHLKTFDKTITIEVTKEQLIIGWIKENYKWLITTLLLPLVVFLFKEKILKSKK